MSGIFGDSALVAGFADAPAGVHELLTVVLLHAVRALAEAVLGHLPNRLILAVALAEPFGEEIALGQPPTNVAFVARAADDGHGHEE